jgi:hypothetical protein
MGTALLSFPSKLIFFTGFGYMKLAEAYYIMPVAGK